MPTPRWRPPAATANDWPELPVDSWGDTLATLHLWTQIVGKIRLVCGPWINHSWGVTLYTNARGIGTSLVPYGSRGFEITFDFIDHRLRIDATDGQQQVLTLEPQTVAHFYDEVLGALTDLGLPVEIDPRPNEIPDAVPFPDDTEHSSYEPDHAQALWLALVQADRVFNRFRADYLGKVSPVHFFWGSFDLAVTRFSGRTAPDHPGGMPNFPLDVAREAYSHEVTSVGFWPGNGDSPDPIFYAYAYPTPDGLADETVGPAEAVWLDSLGEFALPYEAVRVAADPDAALLSFLHSTHAAAADLAGWPRSELECADPRGADWWHNRPHDSG